MTTTTTPAPTSREAIERKAKSLRWQRSEFNADDREALDAADALLALLERAEAAERERDEAQAENLRNREWARAAEASCLADRAALATAERNRDNWKAHAISRGKRLRKTRDEFINIKDELCDEGDRVYFGSTNHADAFKDAVEWLDDFTWDKIIGEPENWDLLGALEKSRTDLAQAEKELSCRDALIKDHLAKILHLENRIDVEAHRADELDALRAADPAPGHTDLMISPEAIDEVLASKSTAERELANSDTIGNNLQGEIKILVGRLGKMQSRAEAAEAKLANAREALEFYADPAIYKPHPHGLAFERRDLSFHARATLKEIGE